MDECSRFSLRGRTALITGASSGIGLHAAKLYAHAGASVALCARRTDRLRAAVAELQGHGHRCVAVPMDVEQGGSVSPSFDAAEEALGAVPDILVNNAGVILAKKFLDQTEQDIDHVLDTNLKGAFLVAQEAARRMARVGGGSIINMASTSALRGERQRLLTGLTDIVVNVLHADPTTAQGTCSLIAPEDWTVGGTPLNRQSAGESPDFLLAAVMNPMR